jgi:hypothetical protein
MFISPWLLGREKREHFAALLRLELVKDLLDARERLDFGQLLGLLWFFRHVIGIAFLIV